MRVYLDNCCFNRPFDNQDHIRIRLETDAKLFVQELCRNHELDLVWSYILEYENGQNPFDERRSAIEHWRLIAKDDIDSSAEVKEIARQVGVLGIKSKDALHVACAVVGFCEYFLTTDDLILKKLKEYSLIKVITPIQFVELWSEK